MDDLGVLLFLEATPCIGDGHPTFNDGNPYNGYINPYGIGLSFPSPYYMEIMGV